MTNWCLANSFLSLAFKSFSITTKTHCEAAKISKYGELETLSLQLLKLYHDGHAGKCDIDLALEEWVLKG